MATSDGNRAPPRLSSLLRIFLHNDAPVDVSAEVLNRSRYYKGQSKGSENWEGELTWDMILSASSKGGGLGSALKGQPREAFFNFVKQTGKLGGEEAVVDSVTATIFEIAINEAGLQESKAEVEHLVLRAVPVDVWKNLRSQAVIIKDWYETQYPKSATGITSYVNKEYGQDLEFHDNTSFRDMITTEFQEEDEIEEESTETFGAGANVPYEACYGYDRPDDVLVRDMGTRINAEALLSKCEVHASMHDGGGALPPERLAKEIVDLLKGGRGRDEGEVQGRLFELLGEGGFEFLLWVMENREELCRIRPGEIEDRQKGVGGAGPVRGPTVKKPSGPAVASSVVVLSADEKRQEKERRKMERKEARRRGTNQESLADDDDEVVDWESVLAFNALTAEKEKYGEKTAAAAIMAGPRQYHGPKKGLPPGTTDNTKPGYRLVHIPPPPKPADLPKTQYVDIEILEEWARPAFKGTKRLNRIQSEVFETAYYTHENLLICAPTGAGKTNIAMLSMLCLIRDHIVGGKIEKNLLKAIYIAPMKALAQEVVTKFSERLKPLGLVVRELTGDMQLTKQEIDESQLIVTTPEKWDVVTRKGGEGSLVTMVGLVIIDEVHLLADDRGAVIESIVARTQRLVEASQKMVRLVGLSATLPNYMDVAQFLRVNLSRGLFYFGPDYRPVPLDMTFMGVTDKSKQRQKAVMIDLAYEKALDAIKRGYQVMVFVHSRKDTVRTAQGILEKAGRERTTEMFLCIREGNEAAKRFKGQVDKSKNQDLREQFAHGFGIHHAGMLRADRSLTERIFEAGGIKVLCCTATLAWGVNLPAHTVIIKGTEVYNPEKGGFSDLSMLDVMQIFGRAGRPQYDTSGEAIMITTAEALPRYLGLLTEQMPIESAFIKQLPDHLNAEVVSGTVTNIREAVTWLSYTYLFIRMQMNPMIYGITYEERERDNQLIKKRTDLIINAAKILDKNRMVRYDPRSGNLAVTDVGRTASHYYIRHETIEAFNDMMNEYVSDAEAMHVLCSAREFEEVKVRPEELGEIEELKDRFCPLEIHGSEQESSGKSNILLQAYVAQAPVRNFTVISDTNYVSQNAARIGRALFEMCLRKGWCSTARLYLNIAKSIDRRCWWTQSPLRQYGLLSNDIIKNLESSGATLAQLADMDSREIGQLIHHVRRGGEVKNLVSMLPRLEIAASIQPITRGILRMTLKLQGAFEWNDRYHGSVEPWWIWVEDADNERIYHSEYFLLNKKQRYEEHAVAFTIPIFEPLPPQYYVRVVSDRWVGCESVTAVSFQHLILPDRHPPHTDLLDLAPLPKSALNNETFESLYKFEYFNPIQTQVFHVVYHTEYNVLVGAPTGSGKTMIAELAILRNVRLKPKAKAVYIAPLKALARERLLEWKEKLGKGLGLVVLELSGDVTPDIMMLKRADIIIATPEKWDGITRNWKKREYVTDVQLVVIDEIHLLGEDRGPVLEVLVSRMRYISSQTDKPCRVMGLSTALANPKDIADWLGIDKIGLYNFRPSVRPIPMEVHVQGFPGRHYCPRMATMNKPTYASILEHSPEKPSLVFVSSRRQTRLTALDLISYCAQDENPKRFLHMGEEEVGLVATTLKDAALRHTLVFGVGIHHAGLDDHDRSTVEELFVSGKIQVLVCTSTLAWGVNFPAHLVVVKGTEYFDAKSSRYVDFPVTDILQMMGRAGRPQFDTKGVACILVHDPKKNFIKKFLYEPFPVESQLKSQLHNHMNAEIAGGAIKNKQDAVEYLTWTFFFRRLVMNPSYYNLDDSSPDGIRKYLLDLVDSTLADLESSGCIAVEEDFITTPTILGYIASYYYLDYRSVGLIKSSFLDMEEVDYESVTKLLSDAKEFDELPVRHNEDKLNFELSETLPWVPSTSMDDPHTKAFLLFQAHYECADLPIADYVNDTKSVLEQAPRVVNAMVDIASDLGLMDAALTTMEISQMIFQGMDAVKSSLAQLNFGDPVIQEMQEHHGIDCLRDLVSLDPQALRRLASAIGIPPGQLMNDIKRVPMLNLISMEVRPEGSGKSSSGGGGMEGKKVNERFVVEIEKDYVLVLTLETRKSQGGVISNSRYKKGGSKDSGWWVSVGTPDMELLALKRVIGGGRKGGGRQEISLVFPAPSEAGPDDLEVHIVSDSLRGLDLHLPLKLLAVEGPEATKEI